MNTSTIASISTMSQVAERALLLLVRRRHTPREWRAAGGDPPRLSAPPRCRSPRFTPSRRAVTAEIGLQVLAADLGLPGNLDQTESAIPGLPSARSELTSIVFRIVSSEARFAAGKRTRMV